MRPLLPCTLALALLAPALAHAQDGQPSWMIMKPEPGRAQELPTPWLPPTYRSPRGTRQHVKPPTHPRAPDESRVSTPPPPIVSPQTGQALPNLRTIAPSGPRGTETFQDKAARCAHQAGMYGAAAGDRSSYIGTCVNQ
jgi:hypothetical protein